MKKQNKAKQKTNKQKYVKKAQYKNQIDLKTRKQNTQIMHNQKEREREKVTKSLRAFFFHTLEEPFRLANP